MPKKIEICMGSSCFARGNNKNLAVISNYIKEHHMEAEVVLSGARCCDKCSDGPNVSIDGVEYNNIDSGSLVDILEKVFEEK